MNVRPATSERVLRTRLDRFWKHPDQKTSGLLSFASELKTFGRVGVFGGMVRDFALGGRRSFHSDIDLVVETNEFTKVESLSCRFGAKRNRFGGLRLRVDGWDIDLWATGSTWAMCSKIVDGNRLDDLPKTTFFNWDAAVYDLENSKLYLKANYLSDIGAGVLDVNLIENPNPAGMAARAVKHLMRSRAKPSPKLVQYLRAQLAENFGEISSICQRYSIDQALLGSLRSLLATDDLEELVCRRWWEWQLPLPFEQQPDSRSPAPPVGTVPKADRMSRK